MDLVAEEHRDAVFLERQQLVLSHARGLAPAFFKTSIWDETLYKAWSSIVYSLIPNIDVLESHLEDFCRICDADEVVLFERATFLVRKAKGERRKGEGRRAVQETAGNAAAFGTRLSGRKQDDFGILQDSWSAFKRVLDFLANKECCFRTFAAAAIRLLGSDWYLLSAGDQPGDAGDAL
ncbi:unnamed protein product [Phaeothamnion confervicola]